VKRFVLLVTGGALTLALVIAGGAAARSQATTVRVSAALDAAKETPTPKGDVSAARGTFTATLTKSTTGASMSWRLEFTNLSGPAVAAHVHVAARGAAGPVRVPLCAPCSSGVTGNANVTSEVLDAIQTDRAYVNVHTALNAPGEIRDQVAVVASVKTALRAKQEVPKPKGKVQRAQGTFTATVTKEGATGKLAWRLTYSRLTGRAVAAHIHSGVRGKSGPVIVPLCSPCRNGARGTANVSAAVLSALEAGRAYVNIHTRKNVAGEVRGQIAALPLTVS
jgi:CHRD domain-containing protein